MYLILFDLIGGHCTIMFVDNLFDIDIASLSDIAIIKDKHLLVVDILHLEAIKL
jgi:hypothetical protein